MNSRHEGSDATGSGIFARDCCPRANSLRGEPASPAENGTIASGLSLLAGDQPELRAAPYPRSMEATCQRRDVPILHHLTHGTARRPATTMEPSEGAVEKLARSPVVDRRLHAAFPKSTRQGPSMIEWSHVHRRGYENFSAPLGSACSRRLCPRMRAPLQHPRRFLHPSDYRRDNS